MNTDADPNTARREKGATKKRKNKPTTQTTTSRSRFKPQPQRNNNTCETCDPTNRQTSSCRIYSTTHHNGRCRGHREEVRASTLTAFHSCHRPCIPFRHVRIELKCVLKHCKKREGCNKEKKDQTHHTNNNNKVPFQTTNKQKEQNV